MSKLPVVQSVEVPVENNPVSDYQYPSTSFSSELTQAETSPDLQNNKQTDLEFKAVEDK